MLRSSLVPTYADVAGEYDRHYTRPIDLAENRILRRHLLPLTRGRSVYDLGCGTGLLLELGVSPSRYVGIDTSSPMIAILRGKTFRHPNINTVVGHAEAPTSWWAAQERNGQPDIITSLFAANYLDLEAVGTLAFGHLTNGGHLFLHGHGPRYKKRKNFILGEPEPTFATWTPRRIRRTLADCGFTDIRFKRVNGLPDWASRWIPWPLLASTIYLAAQLLPLRLQYHYAVTARRP